MPDASPASGRAALVAGARVAAGGPIAVLVAGYIGLGALAAGHGLPAWSSVLSTLLVWALPGQIILAEMHAIGAPLAATLLTVALSSARFLPMTIALMPLMRHARHRGAATLAAASLLSLSGWSMAMARFPDIEVERRLPWFVGFQLTCMAASACAAGIGHAIADVLTPIAKTGLVFMAPMYYVLILVGGVRERVAALGLACGAIAGPLAYLLTPQWSVLAGGFAGGTAAWLILRGARRRA